jgi:hypothetical protein
MSDAFLAKLYATTRDIEMALTGWDAAQQEAFLRMQFQFQTTHYRKHYGDALFQVILRDNAPIEGCVKSLRPVNTSRSNSLCGGHCIFLFAFQPLRDIMGE